MFYKAQIRVSIPGVKWAQIKQAERLARPFDEEDDRETTFEGMLVRANVVHCEKNSIKLWKLSGEIIDISSDLEYEFVRYDDTRGLVIIAVFIGRGNRNAQVQFDSLFTFEHYEEAGEYDRAFLIIPTVQSSLRVKAWALAPTGDDAHDTHGAAASVTYLEHLIQVVRL